VVSGTLGLAAGLPIAGGLFGLMMYGVTERDRLQSQAGELENIITASGHGVSRQMVSFFAGFQEQAQKFLGISRQEIQSILTQLNSAGVELDKLQMNWHNELGIVGHDVVTMSLAFDRLFEEDSGTTLAAAVQSAKNYGESIENTTLQMVRIGFAASKAGTGISAFMHFVVDLEPQLRYYHADAEAIAGLTLSLQDEFIKAGMASTVAMDVAKKGMGQIASGLSNLSIGLKAHIGESTGLGEGLDAAYALTDSIRNADPKLFMGTLKRIAKLAEKETANTGTQLLSEKDRFRLYLEQNLNMGFEGALAMSKILDMQDDRAQVAALESKDWSELRDSFQTESEKMSALEKDKNKILKGMAEVGQGILGVLMSLSGFAIISIKSLFSMEFGDWAQMLGSFGGQALSLGLGAVPADITGLNFIPRTGRNLAIYKKEQEYFDQVAQGFEHIISGGTLVGQGLSQIAYPLITPLMKALGFKSGWNSTTGQAAAQVLGTTASAGAKVVFNTVADAPTKLVQAGGKYTAYAPQGSTLVETKKVPVTYAEVRDAIIEAYQQLHGEAPTDDLADTLAAQAWFESGQTGGLYNYNFGGVKGKGDSGKTALFATHEVINGETLAVKDFFRAYDTLAAGAADFLKILQGRYQAALNEAAKGHLAAYVKILKSRGYFTGEESAYASILSGIVSSHKAKPVVAVNASLTKTPDGNRVQVTTQITSPAR
jgi:hypothetical protein